MRNHTARKLDQNEKPAGAQQEACRMSHCDTSAYRPGDPRFGAMRITVLRKAPAGQHPLQHGYTIRYCSPKYPPVGYAALQNVALRHFGLSTWRPPFWCNAHYRTAQSTSRPTPAAARLYYTVLQSKVPPGGICRIAARF